MTDTAGPRARILYVTSRKASFIALDRALLAERYELVEHYQPGRLTNPLRVARAVYGCDAVVGWWASWHTFLPITLAWILRRPSLLIVGGFDIACEPEIGYGYQIGGLRRWLSRWTMRRASRLMTNSEYSRGELERNTGIPAQRAAVVHHGVPDAVADPGEVVAQAGAEPIALSVGNVDRANLQRKGLRPFVEAAAFAPEVRFLLIGAILDAAGEQLRADAPPNAELAGWVSDEQLQRSYTAAGVYVQPSLHEGFGVSVAEAMLARCVPVTTRAGALPEVVGETGVLLDDASPESVAAGVRRGLELAAEGAGDQARERVLRDFTVSARGERLHELVGGLLARTSGRARR
jgi:glycosyltransferase involved in cell wall biosynthesis